MTKVKHTLERLVARRQQRLIEALSLLQRAFGQGNYPLIMEPVVGDQNQFIHVRFSICLPPEWQGDADKCMQAFDQVWSVPYGHTLPGITFDYTRA